MTMRMRVAAAALACGVLLSAALPAEQGAQTVDTAWLKAIKANDVEALVACYAPNAVMWLPDAPEARGSDAIRAAYAGLLAANTVADATISDAVYQTTGDLSTSWGHFTLTLQPKRGGEAVTMKGRFASVSKKVSGKWAYVADLASVDPAPAPAQAAKP
jgi:ketosteroid isomerase-like protein